MYHKKSRWTLRPYYTWDHGPLWQSVGWLEPSPSPESNGELKPTELNGAHYQLNGRIEEELRLGWEQNIWLSAENAGVTEESIQEEVASAASELSRACKKGTTDCLSLGLHWYFQKETGQNRFHQPLGNLLKNVCSNVQSKAADYVCQFQQSIGRIGFSKTCINDIWR